VTRAELAAAVAERVGDAAVLDDAGNGWPARLLVEVGGGQVPVALYVGAVHSMARKEDERRFQNPGQNRPVTAAAGRPLLAGVAEDGGRMALVSPADPREGLETRFSVLFPAQLVEAARATGWATHENSLGERFVAYLPALLPTVVELSEEEGLSVAEEAVQGIVRGAGLLEDDGEQAKSRARRATSALVRDSRFSRAVRDAYGGRCCLCGLGLGLVAGAHVYPAAMEGSPDVVGNGLALCENHHRAFDRHLVWVDPETLAVRVDRDRAGADGSADEAFIASTFDVARAPAATADRPDPEMFRRRYAGFAGAYDWAAGS
jgi:hypothetical protein